MNRYFAQLHLLFTSGQEDELLACEKYFRSFLVSFPHRMELSEILEDTGQCLSDGTFVYGFQFHLHFYIYSNRSFHNLFLMCNVFQNVAHIQGGSLTVADLGIEKD